MKCFIAAFISVILVGLVTPSIIPSVDELRNYKNKNKGKENGRNTDKLLMANIIYRHGERDMTGSMQLTNTGKLEMYKLGEYFHRRYGKVLAKKYVAEEVYTISTDFDRSIMSAQANLAGFFEPTKSEVWKLGLDWQPIPVHTLPKELDNILRPRYGDRCPKYGIMYDYYMQKSPEVLALKSKYGKFFPYWEEMSGEKFQTIEDIFSLYKKFIADGEKRKLKKWEKEAIKKGGPMDDIAKTVYKIRGLPELVRIRCGFLIKEMLKRFSKKVEGRLEDLKLYIYSAHSSTITTLLNGLGVDQEEIPDHGSGFLFELYEDEDGEHYVQLYLRMPDNDYPKPKEIPGCGKSCPLDKFYDIYRQLIPGSFEDECRM